MRTISVTGHLLGSVSFTRDGRVVALPPSSASLFAYLMLRRGQPVERSRLVDLVGDTGEGAARRRLNTAVWRLRRALEPDGVPRESVLVSVGQGVAVAPTCDMWVDAVEFEACCAGVPAFGHWSESDAERLARAVDLYRGDFLDGVYTDWALAERGRLADLHLTALIRLAEWHRHRGDLEQALRHARSAVAEEPLREDLHRLVIQLYADAALPQMAQRQFERCRAVLASELGIEPLPETVACAAVAGRAPTMRVSRPTAPDHYEEAIRELERSGEELQQMSLRLARSLDALRHERDGLVTDR